MRKAVGVLLAIVVAGAVLAGCGGGKPAADPGGGGEVKSPAAVPADPTSEEAIEQLMAELGKDKWPTELLPDGMPEYTAGKVTSWGQFDNEVSVRIGESDEEGLSDYLDALEAAGWSVERSDYPEAYMGLHYAQIEWQGKTLQITVYSQKKGTWPADQLPPDIYPPKDCMLVGDPYVAEEEKDKMYYFSFVCEGPDADAVDAYFAGLENEGWHGPDQYFKDIEWKGKTWSADLALYEIVGTRSEFTGNLWAQ